MSSACHVGPAVGGSISRQLAEDEALLKALARKDAERQRRRTQKIVKDMADSTTPEGRIAAAKARARAVYATMDAITAQGDLNGVQQASAVDADLREVRIDDLYTLFIHRDRLPSWLRARIEKIHAKINWQTQKGEKAFFNLAVNDNNIPIDKALTILAHLMGIDDGGGHGLDGWIDSIIECGLYPRVKQGKFFYNRRCQDGEHCELCNYLNISDGLKTLVAGYSPSAFYRGGNWFAITVAPRTDPALARAVGRTITQEDWNHDNPDSIVFRESFCSRVFVYPDASESDQFDDFMVEEDIRRFLGAAQFAFTKLMKNGWLDGIRAKVENSIEFLPCASHQHWHAVGSSYCEHDPQKMAEFIKEEVDAILDQTCRGMCADVMVAIIPSPEDLQRWVKYINKTVNVVEAVDSIYNRHPGLRRDDPIFQQFLDEFRLFPQRSSRVFGMIRSSVERKCGSHTYALNRRYVRGNHKFGKGSILSESQRHRDWRTRHAHIVAEARLRDKKWKKKAEAERKTSEMRKKSRTKLPNLF